MFHWNEFRLSLPASKNLPSLPAMPLASLWEGNSWAESSCTLHNQARGICDRGRLPPMTIGAWRRASACRLCRSTGPSPMARRPQLPRSCRHHRRRLPLHHQCLSGVLCLFKSGQAFIAAVVYKVSTAAAFPSTANACQVCRCALLD